MAVQYVKNNNNPLGTLGSLAMVGGTLTGNPFLASLGTGMTAANSMINGNSNPQSVSALQEALKGIWDWTNPADGNIAKSNPNDITPAEYQALKRKWGGVSY